MNVYGYEIHLFVRKLFTIHKLSCGKEREKEKNEKDKTREHIKQTIIIICSTIKCNNQMNQNGIVRITIDYETFFSHEVIYTIYSFPMRIKRLLFHLTE